MILSSRLGLDDFGLIIDIDKSEKTLDMIQAIKEYGPLINTKGLKNQYNFFQNYFKDFYDGHHSVLDMTRQDATDLISKIDSDNHSDDSGDRFITLNLQNSDENLKAGFNHWLEQQRASFARPRINHQKNIFDTWSKYQVLAIFDLTLIARFEGYESDLTNENLTNLLYVNNEKGASSDTARRTAKKHFYEMFTHENLEKLYDDYLSSFSHTPQKKRNVKAQE